MDPEIHQKAMKINPGPQGVPFGVPVDPGITKMVSQGQKSSPQGTKMEPQGFQNYSFGSNTSPTCRKGGRRQGRSLNKSAALSETSGSYRRRVEGH